MAAQPGIPGKAFCRQCRHFFITHEPRQPMGCRAYGFKSQHLPASVVLRSSGQHCRLFARRCVEKGKEKKNFCKSTGS